MLYTVTPEIVKELEDFVCEVPPHTFSARLRENMLQHLQDDEGAAQDAVFMTGLYHLFKLLDAIMQARANQHGIDPDRW